MAETKRIPERSEIAEQDKWAIHDIYATDELWEADLQKAKDLIPTVSAFAGKLGGSAQNLLDYMKLTEEIAVLADALGNYAMRRSDEDARVSKYQAMVGSLMSTYVALEAASSFSTPEIMAISDETMEKFYAELPELERYRPTLEQELRDCLAEMRRNQLLFDLETEPELVEQRIYERSALLCRYRYLQRKARALGLRAIL